MKEAKRSFLPEAADNYTILESDIDFYSIDSKDLSSALNGRHRNKKKLPLTVLLVGFKDNSLKALSKSSFNAGGYCFIEFEYHCESSFSEINGAIFDIYYRDTRKILAKVYERVNLDNSGNIRLHILYNPKDSKYDQLEIHFNSFLGSSPELNGILDSIAPYVEILEDGILSLPSYEGLNLDAPKETDEVIYLPVECTYNSKYFSRLFLLRNHVIANTIISRFDMIQYQVPVKANNESLILLVYGTHLLESVMLPEMLRTPFGGSLCDTTDILIRNNSPIINSILSIRDIIGTAHDKEQLEYKHIYIKYKQLVTTLYSWIDDTIKEAKKEYNQSGYNQVKWVAEYKLYSIAKFWYHDAVFQYSPTWLNGQSIDVFLPGESVGIEYQGKQHFEPIDFFGGEEKLLENARRDITKLNLCEDNGVTLYYWNYDQRVSFSAVSSFLNKRPENLYSQLELMKATPISMVLEKDQTFAQSKGAKIREEKKVVQNSRLEVIRQYSSSGEYLAEFSSIKNAALHSEISMTSIQKCLVGERKTAGGYIWKREKKESVPKKLDLGKHNTSEKISVENAGLPKRVVQIDVVTGEVIRIHDSVGQAAKSIGINSKGIHDVIKGKQKTAGGYLWQFAD